MVTESVSPRTSSGLALLAIPTFEPEYEPSAELESFYTANFDSYLEPNFDHEFLLVISDFKSSEPFKRFLRQYVSARPKKAILIDGNQRLGAYQAANVAFRAFRPDFVGFAESDTRARGQEWLSQLLDDFIDPKVFASFATTPVDGSAVIGQTQAGSIDKPSMKIPFPRGAVPILAVFRGEFLAAFDHRISDVFVNGGCEEGLIWQLRAMQGLAMLNFRCNVMHDRRFNKGRYDRTRAAHWSFQLRDQERDLRNSIQSWLSVPNTFLRPGFEPVIQPIVDGWRSRGARGALAACYVRMLQSTPFFVRNQIRRRGLMSYLGQYAISRAQTAKFDRMSEETRIGMVKLLYGCNPELYRYLDYAIVGTVPGGVQAKSSCTLH